MIDNIDDQFSPLTGEELSRTPDRTKHDAKQRADDGAVIVMPIPDDAPKPPATFGTLGAPHAFWSYLDHDGMLIGYVVRWDIPTADDPAKKTFRPLTLWRTRGGKLEWRWMSWPDPRPLYGLHRLVERPDASVLVVEGEKAADAAAKLFPDHVCITSPGGSNAAGKADWAPLAGRAVTIWPDHDDAGATYADDVARLAGAAGAAHVATVTVPAGWPDKWDLADDLPEGATLDDLKRMVTEAKPAMMPEPPLPLRRPLSNPEPFPVDALGALKAAAEAIHAKTQAPMAICGQSVLAVASLATQAHADVVLPTGSSKPLSCFFLTIADSGERKTSCDDLALKPVRDFVDGLRLQYQSELVEHQRSFGLWQARYDEILKLKGKKDPAAAEADLLALGNPPPPPLLPFLLPGEPTIEGVIKLLRYGLGFGGLFSSEGGAFIGGFGMSADNKLKTAAHLSSIWDGTPIDRVRGGDEVVVLYGRRLSLHLMMQPIVAERLLGDAELIGQGLLSRILVAAPPPAAGTRRWRESPLSADLALKIYGDRITSLLNRSPLHAEGRPAELLPKPLPLSLGARSLWVGYHDTIEAQCGPKGALAPINGLANKLPEHAARLAAVLEMTNNPDAAEIDAATMADAITLATFYQGEALRLFGAGQTNPDLVLAEKVLGFVREQAGPVSLRSIYQRGPNGARDKATATRIMGILAGHNWLEKIEEGAEIDGHKVRDAWRLRC